MAEKQKNQKSFRVIIPESRLSFPSLFKKTAFGDSTPKFEGSFLIPKKADMSQIKNAIKGACIAEWGPDKSKWPKNLKMPVKDGDEKSDREGYEGHWVITARTNQRPGVVDRAKNPIEEESGEIYGGCYVRAAITFKAFVYRGANGQGAPISQGVSAYLGNVQKIRDGDSFGAANRAPEDDFDDLPDEDGTSGGAPDSALDEGLGF